MKPTNFTATTTPLHVVMSQEQFSVSLTLKITPRSPQYRVPNTPKVSHCGKPMFLATHAELMTQYLALGHNIAFSCSLINMTSLKG